MKETFEKIVKALNDSTVIIPCKVEFDNRGQIDIVCGFNYPESLCDKIEQVLKQAGIKHNEYSICADVSGTTVIECCSLNGGPKHNYTREDGNWG